LRGGVHGYAAQASPKIDTAKAEKDPFRMETIYSGDGHSPVKERTQKKPKFSKINRGPKIWKWPSLLIL